MQKNVASWQISRITRRLSQYKAWPRCWVSQYPDLLDWNRAWCFYCLFSVQVCHTIIRVVQQFECIIIGFTEIWYFNTFRMRQNGWLFAGDIFKCIFFTENFLIQNKNFLEICSLWSNNNKPALLKMRSWPVGKWKSCQDHSSPSGLFFLCCYGDIAPHYGEPSSRLLGVSGLVIRNTQQEWKNVPGHKGLQLDNPDQWQQTFCQKKIKNLQLSVWFRLSHTPGNKKMSGATRLQSNIKINKMSNINYSLTSVMKLKQLVLKG